VTARPTDLVLRLGGVIEEVKIDEAGEALLRELVVGRVEAEVVEEVDGDRGGVARAVLVELLLEPLEAHVHRLEVRLPRWQPQAQERHGGPDGRRRNKSPTNLRTFCESLPSTMGYSEERGL
jgi:hypothetical protein